MPIVLARFLPRLDLLLLRHFLSGIGLIGLCLLLSTTLAQAQTGTLQPNADGTVTDSQTGLTWMRCAMGQTWTGSTCTGKASSHTFDQANTLTGTVMYAGKSDWRMPTIHELQTIADRSVVGPAIDSVAFPNTPGSNFWSSEPYVGSSNYAWLVSFYDGSSGYNSRSSVFAVRLVRGGQTASTTTTSYDAKGTSAGATAAVASTTVTVNTCNPSLGTNGSSVSAAASTGSVSVNSACAWTATSNANWLTISSGASGSGSGIVSYTVAANTGTTARTGTLSIAGQTFTVAQKGFTPAAPVAMAQGINASGTGKAASATSYTVPGTLGNDVFVLTAGNRYYGGAGNDTYIISPATLRGDVTAQIIDIEGDNLIQLVDGMTVTASTFYSDAAQLTLSSGAKVQILGASKFKFQIGANSLAGDTAGVLTYSEFVTSLGASLPTGTLPTSGTAGYLVPTGFTQAAAPVPSVAGDASTVPGTLGDDVLVPSGGNTYYGGGGNDTYIISPYTLSGAVTAKIVDKEGTNVIQLVNGLTIATSSFLNDAAQITLSNGAIVQILGASGFSYQLGANAPAAEVASSLNYAQFATTLGASVPAAGAAAVSGSVNYVVQKIDTSPKVNIQISSPKVHVGEQATITWDTANVTNCIGSDGLIGAKPNVGSSIIEPTAGGQFKYSISCTPIDGGSAIYASTSLIVPMPLYKTSYENRHKILLDNPTFSPQHDLNGMTWELISQTDEKGWNGRAFAFADFLQNGEYTVVVPANRFANKYPDNVNKYPDSAAKIYFLQKDKITGKWNDITSLLIKNEVDRNICISPTYAEIADINNDNKPDVFFACTGVDFGEWSADGFSDPQYILLSQPDNSYKLSQLPIGKVYAHQASLADINNDGNIDIITVDPNITKIPFILWGNGKGDFIKDTSVFPQDMYEKSIFGIYAIPINNTIQVVVSGNTENSFVGYDQSMKQWTYGLKVLTYTGGKFQYTDDITSIIPLSSKQHLKYSLALDLIYSDNSFYTFQVLTDYSESAIIKYDLSSRKATILAENVFNFTSGLLHLTSTNELVIPLPSCFSDTTIVFYTHDICNWKLQLN